MKAEGRWCRFLSCRQRELNAVAGLVIGNPVAVIICTAVSAASHYAVDWTRKFGLRQMALAVVLDQACHLLTILVLVLTG
jgi:hypothetical protein